MNVRATLGLLLATSALSSLALAKDGPYSVGDIVTLPNGVSGQVVGYFREIPEGLADRDNPGHFRYSVLIPKQSETEFGLSVVTIEQVNGRIEVQGPAVDEKAILADYQNRVLTARSRMLAATAEGRAIQATADKQFEKWNKRNDRSVKKFTTVEGYTSLAVDMALAGAADKAKGALKSGPFKTTNDLERMMQEAWIDAVKGKLSSDLPLSLPPFNGDQAANVELTKGGIKAVLMDRLGSLPPESRAAMMTNLLVQFGGRAITSEDDSLEESAINALTDVATDLAVAQYPIAGPLAHEAVELARQLNGYMGVLDGMQRADSKFTAAINALHDSRGAKQSIEQIKQAESKLLKQASDSLFKEDPALEKWVVTKVAGSIGTGNRRLLWIDPGEEKKQGPPSPAEVLKEQKRADLLLTATIPWMIQSAGVEDSLVAARRLGADRPDLGRRPTPNLGVPGFDMRLPRDSASDPLGNLRDLFNAPRMRGGLDLDAFQPPPKPTLDEKQALARDGRLKRMAEAERYVPRLTPQIMDIVQMQRLIGSMKKDGSTLIGDGLDLDRGSNSRPLMVIPYNRDFPQGPGVGTKRN